MKLFWKKYIQPKLFKWLIICLILTSPLWIIILGIAFEQIVEKLVRL